MGGLCGIISKQECATELFYGTDYKLGFHYAYYTKNGNLYVGLLDLENEDEPYFMDLTINITGLLPFQAAIDNTLDRDICDWLERIGAGKRCGMSLQNHFAEFPLFQFDPEFLKDANPESFAGLLTE